MSREPHGTSPAGPPPGCFLHAMRMTFSPASSSRATFNTSQVSYLYLFYFNYSLASIPSTASHATVKSYALIMKLRHRIFNFSRVATMPTLFLSTLILFLGHCSAEKSSNAIRKTISDQEYDAAAMDVRQNVVTASQRKYSPNDIEEYFHPTMTSVAERRAFVSCRQFYASLFFSTFYCYFSS